MQKFILGNDNFGVGKIMYKIDNENSVINDLTIIGDQQLFEALSDDKQSEWNWALYPPKLYLREVPYQMRGDKIEIAVTEESLDNYDIALYFMEHNDINGVFTIDENKVLVFEGTTYISGVEKKLKLEVKLDD